ncbi:3,4-dihydroxy-2-butanone-4-phosphate synthase [Rhodococcus koreensis]
MDCPTTRVQRALSDLSAGRHVVLTGAAPDSDAHLVIAAEKATVESVAFLVRFGSGLVCAALPGADCDRLQLTSMTGADRDHTGTDYTVSVDADRPGTGISASDRAHTLRCLAEPTTSAEAFTRPGHVLAARTARGGVLDHRRPAEASVDLATIAGLSRAGTFTALVSEQDPTAIAGTDEAESFAHAHQLGVVSIDDVVIYRRITELHMATEFAFVRGSKHGDVNCVGYRSDASGHEYIAYTIESFTDAVPLISFVQDVDPAPHLSAIDHVGEALSAVSDNGGGTVVVARPRVSGIPNASLDADLVEIVRECGYRSGALHNFPAAARTMMWHFGLSISSSATVLPTSEIRIPTDSCIRQPSRVVGQVVRGDQRGRELGFRTANLELADSNTIADGVWAGHCTLPDGTVVAAAVSVGRRPTFYGRSGIRLVEAHLLDFSGDLYGVTLTVQLDHWMRGQTTFASKEELVAALSADVVRTRSLIRSPSS